MLMLPEAATSQHTQGLSCPLLGNTYPPHTSLAAKNNHHLIISHSSCGSGFGKGSSGQFRLSVSQAVKSQVGARARAATGRLDSPSLSSYLPPSPSLHVVLTGAFLPVGLQHKRAVQLSGGSRITCCYLAAAVTQYHFCCILLITIMSQVHPDSRREELDHLFMGKCQGSRRVCGMEDFVTVQCYFKEDLLTSPVSPGVLETTTSDTLNIISLINASLFQVHLQLLA